jgi:hypothetical protein
MSQIQSKYDLDKYRDLLKSDMIRDKTFSIEYLKKTYDRYQEIEDRRIKASKRDDKINDILDEKTKNRPD